MKIITRDIQKEVVKNLFKGKIIIIYGARQVGKTTLVKEIIKKYPADSAYFNCDEPDIRNYFIDKTSTEMKSFFGNKKLIIIDEAQRVKNIGLALKLIVDNFPAIQIIATGSSSFDLANKIVEPLTGRKYEFNLYPLSFSELSQIYSKIELNRILEQRMVLGMYPEIIDAGNESESRLKSLVKSYLYKDILLFQKIRNSEVLEKLLQALALQIGNEVSYNELAGTVGIDKNTIANYIQILEKTFIIFRLSPFSRNLRSELKKLRKIYFFDTGVRNALINNLNPLNLRQDTGALWENFLLSERFKFNSNNKLTKNCYFWRTKQGKEIDYVEDAKGKLSGYEIKWNGKKARQPKAWEDAYPDSSWEIINRENYQDFIF